MTQLPSLRKNIASLYVVQMASYLAPLITLPWLTRVLGPSGFGELSFCGAVIGYFVLIADYGFNYSATRQIAINSSDRAGRSRVFWNTITVKALLATAGLPCLFVLTLCVDKLAAERSLLLINYLTVLGTVLTPAWYFQGIERQTVLSSITVAVRAISVPATFMLVRSSKDLHLAVLISSSLPVVGGLICLSYIFKNSQVDGISLKGSELVHVFAEGWHLFVSTASVSLYGATNTVLLGLVAGDAAVGHYAAAEKLVQAAQGLLVPINQAVYPRVSRLLQESRETAYALIRKVLRVQGTIALGLSLLLFAVAPVLIRVYIGPNYEETISVLRWLALLPFLVGLSNVLGVHTMLAIGMNKTVSHILVTAGAFNVLLLLLLTRWYGAVGAAMAVVTTEFLVTAAMAMILTKRNIPVFRVPAAT